MRRFLITVSVMVCALAVTAGADAASAATITRATLPSSFVDENNVFYPATCDITQVINDNGRTESFHCTFDDAVPAPFVCDTSIGCLWFSDFDGAEAVETHFVITRSGLMVGWAKY